MSQTKAQLIQPIGVVTASGVVVSGVMTAATFDGDIVGSATSIIQGTNLNLGAFNATSFAGDFTDSIERVKLGEMLPGTSYGTSAKAAPTQGSGWAYLSKNGAIKTTPNQSYKTDILMPIDMWEHSFMDYIPAKDAKKKYITVLILQEKE